MNHLRQKWASLQREGFLNQPHPTLYPPVWGEDEKIRPEARDAFLAAALDVLPDVPVRFAIIGSGACYNWDEAGDLDIQVWVNGDDAAVGQARRAVVRNLMGLTTADYGLGGSMEVQFFAKQGEGTPADNLAGKPYACYDLDADEWLVHPFPLLPELYGSLFLTVEPRAKEIAAEAEALLGAYDRAVAAVHYWSSLGPSHPDFAERAILADTELAQAHAAVKAILGRLKSERSDAYAPGGVGIYDARDALWKMLEVWGIKSRLMEVAAAKPRTATLQRQAEGPGAIAYRGVQVAVWVDTVEDAIRAMTNPTPQFFQVVLDEVVTGSRSGGVGQHWTFSLPFAAGMAQQRNGAFMWEPDGDGGWLHVPVVVGGTYSSQAVEYAPFLLDLFGVTGLSPNGTEEAEVMLKPGAAINLTEIHLGITDRGTAEDVISDDAWDTFTQRFQGGDLGGGRQVVAKVASTDTFPAQPESVAVPPGHYRLFHRTPLRNADSIRATGLGAEHSSGLEFEGQMVWGTFGFDAAVGNLSLAAESDWAIVEYHVPWDPSSPAPSPGGAYTSGSVPPSDIIAIWEPWHFAVWVIADELRDGRYALEDMTFLIRDGGPAYATALEWLDRNDVPGWMR